MAGEQLAVSRRDVRTGNDHVGSVVLAGSTDARDASPFGEDAFHGRARVDGHTEVEGGAVQGLDDGVRSRAVARVEELVIERLQLEGEAVVVKHRYSAFVGPELEVALERLGRRSLIFTGFATSICVESSLREAVCRDYVATIVEDCCGDYSERAHERALQAVANGFGLVATSAEVIGHWTNEMTSPAAQFVAQST